MGASAAAAWWVIVAALISFQAVLSAPVASSVDTEEDAERYLCQYGYLNCSSSDTEARKQAIMDFQVMANVPMTGVIDADTKKKMSEPRCGVSDTIRISSHRRRKRFALQGSQFGSTSLKYRIVNYTPYLPTETIRAELQEAFDMWSRASQLEFRETPNTDEDIAVLFAVGDHGDGMPFDAQGEILAHAFFPEHGGDIHFNDAVVFTSRTTEGVNFFQLAAHEIGHAIGLLHSSVESSVMYPTYLGYNESFTLDPDDIMGVRALYGAPATNDDNLTSTSTTTVTTTVTVTSPPTTTSTSTLPPTSPNVCELANFDAITTHQTANGSFTYAFKGNYVIRLSVDGSYEVVSFDQSEFHAGGAGPSGDLDAASYWPAFNVSINNQVKNRLARTYLFKGSLFWRYDENGLLDGYPKNISTGFPGVPDNIDATMQWSKNGKIYFFKGSDYYRFEPGVGVPSSYPRDLYLWSGLPSDGVDAVVDLGYNNTFFFADDKIYHFNGWSNQVSPGFPQITQDYLFGCDEESPVGNMRMETGFKLEEATNDDDPSGTNTKIPSGVSGQGASRALPFGITIAPMLVFFHMM